MFPLLLQFKLLCHILKRHKRPHMIEWSTRRRVNATRKSLAQPFKFNCFFHWSSRIVVTRIQNPIESQEVKRDRTMPRFYQLDSDGILPSSVLEKVNLQIWHWQYSASWKRLEFGAADKRLKWEDFQFYEMQYGSIWSTASDSSLKHWLIETQVTATADLPISADLPLQLQPVVYFQME